MKKILGLTSIRSDYDLLSPLYRLLNDDPAIDFRLLVTGAHLSKTFGNTIKLIESDSFKILAKLETLLDSDSEKSRLKSAAIMLISAIDVVSDFKPDVILFAGDREDVMVGALLGTYLYIPTIHFYGGDHTQTGHVDDHIRHSISKLSTYHFVSNEEHKKRLICIGESPERIFNIGSISLDRFYGHSGFAPSDLSDVFKLQKMPHKYALVIYHPMKRSKDNDKFGFKNILDVLENNNIPAFISYPNSDPGNWEIIEIAKEYAMKDNFYFFKTLEKDVFMSLYKSATFQIGNSSSGIMESASIPIPAINVGERQKGRRANPNVIFCKQDIGDIQEAILKATSNKFLNEIKGIKNIYGKGNSAKLAYKLIKEISFEECFFKTEDPLFIRKNKRKN
ncbi:MAG: UDP-N-acetylglucosamine 2-epimerase (hydrolyzing) [Bacteroidetes bacterium]|nr:UDP-N-acetylglucosamine 2-epimerase (hydrolyzing) [Bacteroidota bacterium]